MELYQPEKNAAADIQRIKDKLTPYYTERFERGEISSFKVEARYDHMNLFYAWVKYDPVEFPGEVTAHYTVLILNGEVKFQN
jgi:phage/plasmid-associated DNA primase